MQEGCSVNEGADKQLFLKLVNRLYEVILGNLSTFTCWGFYLFSEEFDKEPELRNKLGVLWICALLDSVQAQKGALHRVIIEASDNGFESIEENGRQLQNFCVLIAEFLGEFSREEQIYLIDLRNQWVHSYLINRHQDNVKIKYVADGEFMSDRISSDVYNEILRSCHARGASVDEVLSPIIARALNLKKHRYWRALQDLQKDHDAIYQAFRDGNTIKIDV